MHKQITPQQAQRRAAMWQRLATQCHRSGEHDLALQAEDLAQRHRQNANHAKSTPVTATSSPERLLPAKA